MPSPSLLDYNRSQVYSDSFDALRIFGPHRYDLNLFYEYLIDFDISRVATMNHMIKGTLFVWMRYAEGYPSSKLDDYQTFFYSEFCHEFDLHRIPDDHRLRRLMHR